jgi:SET domain-containing protein
VFFTLSILKPAMPTATKRRRAARGARTTTNRRRSRPQGAANEWVIIKRSPIEGLGVFAKKDIPRGTKIADYYGEEMKWKTFKERYGEYKTNSLHTYPMRRIWKILVAKEEPYKSRNLVNYINELPGKANCELRLRALFAKRDIQQGEELLLQYPHDYNRFWLKKPSA